MLRAFASGRVFGERYGEGPLAVLALHGWRRSQVDFKAMLEGGVETGRGRVGALAVDLPGHGASPPPDEPWGSTEYASALEPVLETMDRPVVVVGHSFGGRVALQLALHRPDQVRGLVLTGVPLLRLGAAPRPPLGYRVVRRLARLGLVPERRLEAARARHGSEDYRAAEGVMREVLVRLVQERYEDALAALSCPVELVVGGEDRVAPLAVAEAAAGLVARARLTVVPGVGHLEPIEAPEALRAAVARLLA